jgi:DNA (cytosine-5)-methyltransferase 1
MIIESGASLRDTREKIGLSQAKLAEITGIPQHALSGYELGKFELDKRQLNQLQSVLGNAGLVSGTIARKKRYQSHEYKAVVHDPRRVDRYAQTLGNKLYLELLSSLSSERASLAGTAISLFSGCGGLSLGFAWAGFAVKGFL